MVALSLTLKSGWVYLTQSSEAAMASCPLSGGGSVFVEEVGQRGCWGSAADVFEGGSIAFSCCLSLKKWLASAGQSDCVQSGVEKCSAIWRYSKEQIINALFVFADLFKLAHWAVCKNFIQLGVSTFHLSLGWCFLEGGAASFCLKEKFFEFFVQVNRADAKGDFFNTVYSLLQITSAITCLASPIFLIFHELLGSAPLWKFSVCCSCAGVVLWLGCFLIDFIPLRKKIDRASA